MLNNIDDNSDDSKNYNDHNMEPLKKIILEQQNQTSANGHQNNNNKQKSQSSDSQDKKKEVLDASNEPIFQPENNSVDPSKIITLPENKNEIDELQTYELEEALRKQQQFLSEDQIFSEENIFVIQQDNFLLVNELNEKCKKACYTKFNNNKILREAWSDN